MINRVVFTGDFLRVNDALDRTSFVKNTTWLYRLLNKQLSAATGLPCEVIEWGVGYTFDGSQLYKAYGKEASTASWAALFNEEELKQEALDYIAEHFAQSIVVGFELPPLVTRLFDALGIHYVDVSWHAIRFMDDIFFGFKSNHKAVVTCIEQYRLPEAVIYAHAELIRARAFRKELMLDVHGTLLIGQTEVDRSLIHKGKVVGLADFASELSGMGELWFKPHPFHPAVTHYPHINPEYNMYDLLCCEQIEKIVALSSGVLEEAKYFEKEAHRLLPPIEKTAPVYHEFLGQDFWADILAPITSTHAINQPPIFLPNRMRHANCASWGFQESHLENIIEDYG